MECKVKAIHNDKATFIPVGSLTWSESDDSLGTEFSFSLPYSKWDTNYNTLLSVGDTVVIYLDNDEILRGIITTASLDGSYSGYDYAFYLNKSEAILQFKKVSATEAITKICSKWQIPVDTIPAMATSINQLYKDEVLADILTDILKKVKRETGTGYRMEMKKGKLRIVKKHSIKISPTYRDELGRKILCTQSASISGSFSIEEMINQVTIAGSDDNAKQIKATAKSSKSIEKYGLLSAVETYDDINEAKARNKAKNMLADKNKVKLSFTAEMMGNPNIKPCRSIYFNRPEYNIKGYYKIKSCSHSINNGIYRVSMELEN